MMLIIVSEALEGSHPTCSKCNSIIVFVIVGEVLCILMCVCVCHGSQSRGGPINPFKILNMHRLVRLIIVSSALEEP